jgi:Beta-ketoacyl synthase, N-terminal domain
MSFSKGIEPIAIVGMAMRFPGGSHSSEQFWQMLIEGRSAHKKIPKERFDAEGYYHPDAARAGAVSLYSLAYNLPSTDWYHRLMSKAGIFYPKTQCCLMLLSFQ